MEANINSTGAAGSKPSQQQQPRRQKKVFGIRDQSAKIREPEADPDQTNLIKKLQVNFDEIYVAAVANRIYVYESEHLKPIDILSDHKETVRGLAVAQMFRNIVSFSRGAMSDETTFMVHCLVDAEHVREQQASGGDGGGYGDQPGEAGSAHVYRPPTLQDEAVYMGRLKWQLTYKETMLNPARLPKSLAISAMGDFCVMGGQSFVSLWTIDALMDSYSKQLVFAAPAPKPTEDEDESQLASQTQENAAKLNSDEAVEEMPDLNGEVCQSEVCGSGRMFATLERGKNSLKIWHNTDVTLQKVADADVDFRRFYMEGAASSLEAYELPGHRSPIQHFHFLATVGSSRTVQPSVLLTVCRRKAFIWVESLEVSEMAFNCVQSFDIGYDACFIDFNGLSPKATDLKHINLKYDCSKLFHSYNDAEKHAKSQLTAEKNAFGIVPSGMGGNKRAPASIDWLLLLNAGADQGGAHLSLVQCKGLRNAPSVQFESTVFRKIAMPSDLRASVTVTRLLSSALSSYGRFDDKFYLMAMSDQATNIFKCSVDLAAKAPANRLGGSNRQAACTAELNAAIRANPAAPLKIQKMLTHESLPLIALVYGHQSQASSENVCAMGTLIEVYKLQSHTMPTVNEPDFTLHGTYKSPGKVLDVIWAGDLDQLIVLDESQRVSLITSHLTLKVLSLYGNRQALQEEMNKVLGQDPSVHKLTLYRTTTALQIKESDENNNQRNQTDLEQGSQIKNVIFVESTVRDADQPHTYPSLNICFAAIGQNGGSTLHEADFQIDMDYNCCELSQRTLKSSTPFEDNFYINKLLATQKQSSASLALFLAQKDPEQQLAVASNMNRGPQKKPAVQLRLISISKDKGFETQFVAPGNAEELLEQPVVAKFSSTMLAILVSQGSYAHESHYIYLYSLESCAYVGFLDLNRMLGVETERQVADFVFLEDKIKGAIALTCLDRTYVLYQKQSTWEVLPSTEPLTNMRWTSELQVAGVKGTTPQPNHMMIISLHDGKTLLGQSEAKLLSTTANRLSLPKCEKLHKLILQRQRSLSLFHPSLLAELYYKGYGSFVVNILLKLKEILTLAAEKSKESSSESEEQKLSDYLDMDLESLLVELKNQAEQLALAKDPSQSAAAAGAGKNAKKATAFSVFDDLDESESEEEEKEAAKEEEKVADDPKKLFKEGAEALATLLTTKKAVDSMGLDSYQAKQLVTFVLKFKNIFEIDFYVDPLASMLLRKVFYETETVDDTVLQDIQAQLDRNEQAAQPTEANEDEEAKFMNYQVEEVKPFSMEEYMAIRGNEPQVQSSGDLDLVTDWTSSMVCQALHSENQEVVMNYLAERFSFEKNLTWNVMRKLCIPIWLKDINQVKKYIEFVAKTEYRINEGKPSMCKADHAAIWYTLLGKRSVLQSLYGLEVGHERFAQFFSKDFTQEKTRTIAQKNGMALIAKQKNHLACSFLLLGDKLGSAVQVALDRLKDPVLAILMCRVHDPLGKTGALNTLLDKWFIERGEKFNDPFLTNIGFWLKKEFVKSVNQLAPDKEDSCLSYFYKNDVSEFDLVDSSLRVELEADAAAQAAPAGAEEEATIYPIVSRRNYVVLDLVKRLRKAPDVKRALNQLNAKGPGKGGGGAGSIFDDFLGGGSDSSSEQEEEKKEAIEVEDSQVLRQAIKQTLVQRQTVLSLLLIEENKQVIEQLDKGQVDRLSQTLLLDLVVNIVESENANESVKHLRNGLDLLSRQLSLEKDSSRRFLLKQLQMLGLLQFRVEFLADTAATSINQNSAADESRERQAADMGTMVMQEQTFHMQTLIHQMSISAGTSLNAFDYDKEANQALIDLVEKIEILLNCMLNLNFPSDYNAIDSQSIEGPAALASRSVLSNQGSGQPNYQDKKGIAGGRGKVNALNLRQMPSIGDEDHVGGVDEDSDEDQVKQEVAQILKSPQPRASKERLQQRRASPGHDEEIWDPSNGEHRAKEDQANIVAAKFRTDLTLVMALQTLAILLAKYGLAKDLCEELRLILGVSMYADQMNSLSISEQQLQALKSTLRLDKVKEHLLKIKGTLNHNVQFHYRQPDAQEVGANATRRRKPAQSQIHKSTQPVYDFLDIWLRQMLASRTANLLQKSKVHEIKLLGTNLLTHVEEKSAAHMQRLLVQHSTLSTAHKFLASFSKLDKCLSDSVTYTFSHLLKPVDQRLITCELEQIVGERYRSLGKSLSMGYFFSNLDKLKTFATSFEMHTKQELLQDLQLGLISSRFGADDQPDAAIQNSMISTGIELFKQRSDAVVDICFDQTGANDMMAMAIQAKGMREISVIDTLVYRNRRDGGLEMIDEDQMSWAECLHRYEQIQQLHSDLKPSTDAVKAAIYGLYYHSTMNHSQKTLRPASATLIDIEAIPAKLWSMQPTSNYSKTYSDLRITHDDYTNAIESHPFLPLYLSGNAKGLVCTWNFNQMADKSLSQWVLDKDTPPQSANPKKSTVKRIEFNSYGDRFAALNTGGQLFIMNFDLETSSKVEPVFTTMHTPRLSEVRLSDFTFLDRDSIVAGVSMKDKSLNVYDTLLPPRQSMVQQHKSGNGGNLMQVLPDQHKVLCFNAKPGYITEYDLRKEGEFTANKLLTKEEITAVALSPKQDSLVLGQADGIVKIFDLKPQSGQSQQQQQPVPNNNYRYTQSASAVQQNQSNNSMPEKGSINAFTNYGKKGGVTRLRFHPENGALFAASNVGCVKLLRLSI